MSREIKISITGKKIIISNDNRASKQYVGETSTEIAQAIEDFCQNTYKEVLVSDLSMKMIGSLETISEEIGITISEDMYDLGKLLADLSEEIRFFVSDMQTQKETKKGVLEAFEEILDNNFISLPEFQMQSFREEIWNVLTKIKNLNDDKNTILLF